jgi:2-polyprenyl-3-methyl-5-hydroxy-6-metoxy-1,4-benzoquinol methylase
MKKNIFGFKEFDINLYHLRPHGFYKNMISQRNHIYKKFKKFLIQSKNSKCLLCKSKKNQIFLKWKKYNLFLCKNCSLVFTNIDFKKFNPVFFNTDNKKKKINKQQMTSSFNYRLNNFAFERVKYIQENIKLKKNDIVFDYGCGFGSFLYALKKKKILSKGSDFDQDSINFCKTKKLEVSNLSLENEKNNSIKLITLFDVIEHLEKPINFLKTARKKLKQNGYVLMFTPNIHSLSGKLMGEDHNMFAVFNHLCFYNYNSLSYLAKKTGFKILKIEYYGLDIKDYLQMLESDNKKIKFNKILNNLSNILQSVLDKYSLSNSMRIFFKKI